MRSWSLVVGDLGWERTYPCPAEIGQGWHQALDGSMLGRFCMERAPMGTCVHEHAACHVVGGECDEM